MMAFKELGRELTPEERALLEDVLRALDGMRYGSILLTVHDGRLVEVQKTERIRKSPKPQE